MDKDSRLIGYISPDWQTLPTRNEENFTKIYNYIKKKGLL